MGTEVEKALWPEIKDRSRSKPLRKLALSGLRSLAERYPTRHLAIVNQLAGLLAASTKEEANFNGYIVFVLDRLEAIEVKEVIEAAFEQKKVDPCVFKQSSLALTGIAPEALKDISRSQCRQTPNRVIAFEDLAAKNAKENR